MMDNNTIHFTIEVALNEKTGRVDELVITKGLYDRTEFMGGNDPSMSIRETARCIREELEFYAER